MSRKCYRCHKIITGDHYYSNEKSLYNCFSSSIEFYCSLECAMIDAGIVRHEMTETDSKESEEEQYEKTKTDKETQR